MVGGDAFNRAATFTIQFDPFASTKHWVLTFHDSTLEALADGIMVHGDFRSRTAAIAAMMDRCALD